MESRAYDSDKPLHVMLAYGPLGLVRATAQELQLGGMVVDTGTVTLGEEMEVEVSFTHRRKDEVVTHRISATVTRSFRGGAVLAFRSHARTTLQVLRHLVKGRRMPDFGRIAAIPRINSTLLLGGSIPIPPGGRA